MKRDREQLLAAMRFPDEVFERITGADVDHYFGMWSLMRAPTSPDLLIPDWPTMTVLTHITMATMHRVHGEVVMEDSLNELRRHLPIMLVAHGHVLITGLGMGCVVRGLLTIDEVDHIDVIEMDDIIIGVIGDEFEGDPRVTLHHMDALDFNPAGHQWDYAWHDLWYEEEHEHKSLKLHQAHIQLIHNFRHYVTCQGCWGMDRNISRVFPMPLLNARRRRPNLRKDTP